MGVGSSSSREDSTFRAQRLQQAVGSATTEDATEVEVPHMKDRLQTVSSAILQPIYRLAATLTR